MRVEASTHGRRSPILIAWAAAAAVALALGRGQGLGQLVWAPNAFLQAPSLRRQEQLQQSLPHESELHQAKRQGPGRRAALSQAASLVAATWPGGVVLVGGEVAAAEEEISAREALFRGKLAEIRQNSEWYRFYIGDQIETSTGATAIDRMSAADENCAGGLCAAAMALRNVRDVLPARGSMKVALVDRRLLTPMYAVADLSPDPDSSDTAKELAAVFDNKLALLMQSVRGDGVGASKAFGETLVALNVFFRAVNRDSGAKPEDDWCLPQLPLTKAAEESDLYWQSRRQAYTESTDVMANFRERNALASKDFRQGLKRFPGATLLLR